MKRFLAILTAALMIMTCAAAETADDYQPITDLEQLYGVWAFCIGSDNLPYLVLRPDGTYAGYDFWQFDEEAATGDALLKHGAYAFNAADSSLTLEGIDTVYTAKTGTAWEDLSYPAGSLEVLPDTPVLMLDAPVEGEYDPRVLLLRMESDLALLPILPDLCEGEWLVSDSPTAEPAGAETFAFTMDGQVTMETAGADGATKTTGTFDYTQGLLNVTTDRTYSLLLQFHYVSCIDGTAPEGYDLQQAEDQGSYTALSDSVLVVHDLGDGSVFYLIRSDG